VGDQPLPRLIFFFDEAHFLFEDTPKALTDKIEQIVRLVRSKGVGIYFITQSPSDIPSNILGQLGNRIQHALRAYTPQDQKTVRAAADTFRPNPAFKTEETLLSLGTGEALISFLNEKGIPSMVEKAKMMFPLSQIGPITPDQRDLLIRQSRLFGVYERNFDRESAYELLSDLQLKEKQVQEEAKRAEERAREEALQRKEEERLRKEQNRASGRSAASRSPLEKAIGSAATSIGRSVGTQIVRGILGAILKK